MRKRSSIVALGTTLFAATTALAANGANDYLLSVTPPVIVGNSIRLASEVESGDALG